jgi:hypothetical protein
MLAIFFYLLSMDLIFVFTTRLVSIAALANVVDSLCGALDFVGILVRNFDREFLLDSHNDFDSVETVKTEIVGEAGVQ